MFGQNIENLFAVVLSAASLDAMAEYGLFAGVVDPGIEPEAGALPRILDRPSCEGARHLCHVLLRIPAVHAQSMQFHQLTPVVFVEASLVRAEARTLAAGPLRKDAA